MKNVSAEDSKLSLRPYRQTCQFVYVHRQNLGNPKPYFTVLKNNKKIDQKKLERKLEKKDEKIEAERLQQENDV